jgi:hypothetical protein
MATSVELIEKIAKTITQVVSLPCINMRTKETNLQVNCLSLVVALDIFRGLRKYLFTSKKKIRLELAHLLNKDKYPAHYPSYLKQGLKVEGQQFQNPVYLSEEDIKKLNESLATLHMSNEKPRVLISEHFFSQLISLQSMQQIEDVLAAIFARTDEAKSSSYKNLFKQTNAEARSNQIQGAYTVGKMRGSLRDSFVNFTYFASFVPDCEKGAKKKLLIDGELEGTLAVTEYYSSISFDNPVLDMPLSALLLSLMNKIMMNSYVKKTVFDIKTERFAYHLKKNKKERYIIRDQLNEDYIVPYGNFRLNQVVKSPIQFVDKISDEFSAENYVRSMNPPLNTKIFLEEFDGHQLLKILESIPGFVYKFSEQQRELIASKQNAVVVGRSGTGKTTCAVMRMIGIRLLEIAHRNAKRGVKKIRYEDLCESKFDITKNHTSR